MKSLPSLLRIYHEYTNPSMYYMPIDVIASDCMLTFSPCDVVTIMCSTSLSNFLIESSCKLWSSGLSSRKCSLVQTVAICPHSSSFVPPSLCLDIHTCSLGGGGRVHLLSLPPSLYTHPLLQLWLWLQLQCLQSAINARCSL